MTETPTKPTAVESEPGPFVTADEEALELEQPPTAAELARIRAAWRAAVPGPLGALLDADAAEPAG